MRYFKAGLFLAITLGFTSSVWARVTKIEVRSTTPAIFGGAEFGDVGTYEMLSGVYHGELDPSDPRLHNITDIKLAERNENGKVEYRSKFMILKPTDMSKSNGNILYEFGNRGNKYALWQFNSADQRKNKPIAAGDEGNGFLMRNGFTIVWSGFLGDAQRYGRNNELWIELPYAKNSDGTRITGKTWDECFSDFWTGAPDQRYCQLTHHVLDGDINNAQLFVREFREQEPREIPRTEWDFWGGRTNRVSFTDRSAFRAGMIYQVVYKTANPKVMGIGFAAVRDWLSFLRHEKKDDFENLNPLAEKIRTVLSYGASQTGRVSRDFVYQGFNEDLKYPGTKVIDGMNVHVAATRTFINFRFAQPFRSLDQKRMHISYPNPEFPFAYENQTDPVTGKTDGILKKCSSSNTCPKITHTISAVEYWSLRNSLVTTNVLGTEDANVPANVRIYHFASTGHFPRKDGSRAACVQEANSIDYFPLTRSLLMSLKSWTETGSTPPPSSYPKISDGTLVRPAQVSWPRIPGMAHPKNLVTKAHSFNYGDQFENGIITVVPPEQKPLVYKIMVPQVDRFGNEKAGILMPEVSVPLKTYTGWNRRAESPGLGDICGIMGSELSLASNSSIRNPLDSRPAVTELYPGGRAEYEQKVLNKTRQLIADGYLLEEDFSAVFSEAVLKWSN